MCTPVAPKPQWVSRASRSPTGDHRANLAHGRLAAGTLLVFALRASLPIAVPAAEKLDRDLGCRHMTQLPTGGGRKRPLRPPPATATFSLHPPHSNQQGHPCGPGWGRQTQRDR